MTEYERMIEHTKRLDMAVKRHLEEREESKKTRNLKYLVFGDNSFERGFNTVKEAENYISIQALELWNECKADNELLGYVPKCNVASYKEAIERCLKFYAIKENIA